MEGSRMEKKKHRLINGSKGFVSLILVVTLLPFYALAATVTEVARYQASVKGVDQAIGSSAMSTLANYDSFLLDRFGLLAMSQDKNYTYKDSESSYINDTFGGYLAKQKTFDLAAVETTEVKAEGVYPLGDVSFLKQQVLQAGSATVPTKLVLDALDYDGFIKSLEKLLDFGHIMDFLDAGIDMLDSEVDMLDSVDTIEKDVKQISDEKEKYRKAFEDWEKAADEYQKHHASGPPAAESDGGAAAKAWEAEDKKLLEAADTARKKYKDEVSKIKGYVESLNSSMESAVQSKQKFESSIVSFESKTFSAVSEQDRVDKKNYTEQQKKAIDADRTLDAKQKEEAKKQLDETYNEYSKFTSNYKKANEQLEQSAKDMNSSAQDAMKQFDSAEVEKYVRELTRIEEEVDKADPAVSPSSSLYCDVSVFADLSAVKKMEKEIEDAADDKASISYIKNLVDILSTLVSTSILYDPNLDTTIKSEVYNNRPSKRSSDRDALKSAFETGDAAKSLEYWKKIRDDYYGPGVYTEPGNRLDQLIDQLMDYVQQLSDGVQNYSSARKAKEKLEALIDMGEAAIGIMGCVTAAAFEIKTSAEQLIAQTLADRLMIMGYLTYNLPNRVNFTSYLSKGGLNTDTDESAINLIPFFGAYLGGGIGTESYSFSGAELEYIFWGDRRERVNQRRHFLAMAFIRMFIDAFSIVANEEVNSIFEALSAIPYVGPVLAVIYVVAVVIGEPLLDTYFLANGGEEPIFFKKTIYLTPSGIVEALEEAVNVTLFTKEKKEAIQASNKTSSMKTIDNLDDKVREKLNKLGLDKDLPAKGGVSGGKPSGSGGSGSAGAGGDGVVKKHLKSLLELDYTQHTFLMGLLLFTSNTKLKRFQDIITMERLQYNHTGGGAKVSNSVSGEYSDFDVDRAYTMLRVNVKGKLKSVLPVPRIDSVDPYTFDRVMYRGY